MKNSPTPLTEIPGIGKTFANGGRVPAKLKWNAWKD